MLTNVDDWKHYEHYIYVKDNRDGHKSVLYKYGRSAEILWSPDFKRLIINDFAGSNVSYAILFNMPPEPLGRGGLDKCYWLDDLFPGCSGVAGAVDIAKELFKSRPPAELLLSAHDPNTGGEYFTVRKWIDKNAVLLDVSFQGNAHRFTFVYHVNEHSFSLIKPPRPGTQP